MDAEPKEGETEEIGLSGMAARKRARPSTRGERVCLRMVFGGVVEMESVAWTVTAGWSHWFTSYEICKIRAGQ